MRFVLALTVVTIGVAATLVALTPANGGMVGGTPIAVDTSFGNQNDPHVSGNLIVYTDNTVTAAVRYFDLLTNTNSAIPSAPGDRDLLSDVSGSRITFSRVYSDRIAVMLYDVSTSTLTEIDSRPGTSKLGTSIGGDTIAYIELGVGHSDLFVYDLAAGGLPINLSASPDSDEIPDVAPDGNAVVWMTSSATGGIMKAIRTGGLWGAPQVVSDTIHEEAYPATDGTFVVYESSRPTSVGGRDIYFQPLSGGAETQLEISGSDGIPSIDKGIIAFSHTDPAPGEKPDIFIYVIATNRLWQVTDTPLVGEYLNDISVLPGGEVRVVWAVDEDQSSNPQRDIVVKTFTLPSGDTTAPNVTITSPADGATYTQGQAVAASYSCQDESGGSGLASCVGLVADGALIDTTIIGSHSFTVTGTDNAGNSASLGHTYNVVYSFTGFLQPVDNLPALNVATAGSAVPVKFSLGGNQGLGIFAAGYPASSPVACSATEPGAVIEETVTAGTSSLSYSSTSDEYTYVWKTDKSWRGTCRILIVRLNEQSEHFARFRFK